MSTNIDKLKSNKKVGNPDPSPPTIKSKNLKNPPREKPVIHDTTAKEATVPVQFKPRESYNNRFCAAALKEYGFKKGSKTNFFEKLVDFYEENHPVKNP